MGTLKNFPGARLAADSRGSLGRAPPPPKAASAKPRRATSFLSKPHRAEARENRGRGRRARWRPAQALRGAGRDAHGLGLSPSGSRCLGRSAGIAPVGGLRAALWVARDERGRDSLSAIVQQQNLAYAGGSGNRC